MAQVATILTNAGLTIPDAPSMGARAVMAEGLNISSTSVAPSTINRMLIGGLYQTTCTYQPTTTYDFGSHVYVNFLGMNTSSNAIAFFNKLYAEFDLYNPHATLPVVIPNIWNMFNSAALQRSRTTIKNYQNSQFMEDAYASVVPIREFQSTFDQLAYSSASLVGAATTVQIPALTTRSYRVPLHWLFPELCSGLPVNMVSQTVNWDFLLNSLDQFVVPANPGVTVAVLTLSNFQVLAVGQTFPVSPTILSTLTTGKQFVYPMIFPQVININYGAVSAGMASVPRQVQMPGGVVEISAWLYANGPPTTSDTRSATASYAAVEYRKANAFDVFPGCHSRNSLHAIYAGLYGPHNVLLPQSTMTTPVYIDRGPRLIFCQHVVPTKLGKVRHGDLSATITDSLSITAPTGGYANLDALLLIYTLSWLTIDANGNMSNVNQAA